MASGGGRFNMVAEEGNRRQGSMSPAEIRQCVLDIVAWFERQEGCGPMGGCDSAVVEGVEKSLGHELPPGLGLLLEKAGAGCWYYERQGLGAEALAKTAGDMGLAEGLVPFASDVDGNLYVVDTTSKGEPVFEWDGDDNSRGDRVAASFEDFIEKFRNDLLSGGFEFIEECGVVEGMGSGGGGGESKGHK